jgi:hypothetical protein
MVKNILYVTAVFLSFFTIFFKLQYKDFVAFGQSVFKFCDKKNRYKKMRYRFDFVGVRINRFLRAN